MPAPVVTRFAPSPTGYLHIGGARTALFNWLYARANAGIMHLRIEDTDRKRSTDEAISAILDGLEWLGLNWDDALVYQHSRAERHAEIAHVLLEQGLAYRCYCSPEELIAMREKAKSAGLPPVYDRTWRDRDAADAPAGVKPVIRFKAPLEGVTTVDDAVQGSVVFRNENLDDLILLRSDGTPTYMMSVVVDDHDMSVSHVIRGDDHLTNAARQSQIYNALGWDVPTFAHIPLIHGPDGAKLSKRHGALGIEAYRDMGYLPEAVRNYLVRLGWSHGDDEIMSVDDMIAWFDLPAINKAPARLDLAKLDHINSHYLKTADDAEMASGLVAFMTRDLQDPNHGMAWGEDLIGTLTQAMPALKPRAKTLADLASQAGFLIAERPLLLDAAASKILTPENRSLLADIFELLDRHDAWDSETLEKTLKDFVNNRGGKLGAVAQPLRAALTGATVSPGIFDVLSLLGKQEALSRIADQSMNGAGA